MSRSTTIALVIGYGIALVAVGALLATTFLDASLVTREVLGTSSEVDTSHDGVDYKVAFAFCDAGELAVGGGFGVGASSSVASEVTVTTNTHGSRGSFGDGPRDGWTVSAMAPVGVGDWELTAYAVCARED
jgi:hypothetical protein